MTVMYVNKELQIREANATSFTTVKFKDKSKYRKA
jgi:hypothetical protein